MANFRSAAGEKAVDSSLWWLLLALVISLCFAGAVFAFVPYLVIFVIANFFCIYVTVVYLLKFMEQSPARTTDRKPSVSIVVPAFNSGRTLRRCLESVLALKYPSKPQIIVVDDASTDGTAKVLREFSRKITVVTNKRNLGKAASLNKAIRMSRGEIVACIDSDTYPNSNALLDMVRHFSEDKVGSVVALVCVDKPKNLLQRIQQVEYFVSFGFWHTALSRLDGLLVTPGPMSLYRRKALSDIGGFDEENITEDMEIALHLQERGWAIRCTTDAKIYTDVPDNLRSLYRQRLRWLRGKIFNGHKYSHMLFNGQYGDFGKFVYPLSFVLDLAGVVVVLRLVALHGVNAINMAAGVAGVARIDPSLLYNVGIYSSAVVSSSAIFFLFTAVVWSYIVLISFDLAKERIKVSQVVPIIIFMSVYSMFVSLVYFSSILHEAVGVKRRW